MTESAPEPALSPPDTLTPQSGAPSVTVEEEAALMRRGRASSPILGEKSAEWHANRRLGIGGSDAGKIMSGRWLELWLVKTGRTEPEDLSDVLAVQMGTVTEDLNLAWFERQVGRQVIGRKMTITHPYYAFMRAELDGIVQQPDAIVEAKWAGAFNRIEELEQRYMPQCHHNMMATGYDRAFLSIITGKPSYELIEIRRDDDYAATLLQYEEDFWGYVEQDEAPPDRNGVVAPDKPSVYRSADMSPSNSWAMNASMWRENIKASRICKKAAEELRSLVEPDVGIATGHGVRIARSKDGKLLIKETRNV